MNKNSKLISQLTLAAALTASVASVQAETALNVVGSWSSLELHRAFEQPFWSEQLPAATDGNITSNLTTHDQLGIPGGDVYNLLSEGLYDVGMTVMDYAVQDAPEMEALDLPMLSQDVATARAIAEAYMPIANLAFEKRFDSKVLAIVPYPQQVVFCRDPVADLADLEGRNIRASGRSTLEFLEAAGATSLNIAFNEVPGALDRGVIDCAVTGSMSGYSSAWYEMADYLYTLPAGGWDYVVTGISLDTWNAMSSSEQSALESSIQSDFADAVWANAEIDTQQGIACLTGTAGCTRGDAADMALVMPSDADVERSQQILEDSVLPSWSSRVDQDVIDMWNDQIGSIVNLTAQR